MRLTCLNTHTEAICSYKQAVSGGEKKADTNYKKLIEKKKKVLCAQCAYVNYVLSPWILNPTMQRAP